MNEDKKDASQHPRIGKNSAFYPPGNIPIVPEGWMSMPTFGDGTYVVKTRDD